jgi:nitrogen fixation NifU-like protein
MSDGYSDLFIDHMESPRNTGVLPDANGVAETTNPVCGDVLRLAVRVEDGTVAAAQFQARGCGGAVAAASLLTELATGAKVEEALALSRERLAAEAGGLPASKLHTAQLAVDALRGAIIDYASRGERHPEG